MKQSVSVCFGLLQFLSKKYSLRELSLIYIVLYSVNQMMPCWDQ